MYMIFVIVCFVCLFDDNFVFGQTENQTPEINEDSSKSDWGPDVVVPIVVPISVAIIAVVGSNYVAPKITEKWKEHANEIELRQKEVQLQTKIAGEISERVMRILVAIMKVEEYYDNEKKNLEELQTLMKARNQEYFDQFKVNSHIIQSEIQAYFEGCLKKWNVLIDLVEFIEQLSDKDNYGDRLEIIKNHSDPGKDKDLNAYEPLEPRIDEKRIY
jgi:hypothetical protein